MSTPDKNKASPDKPSAAVMRDLGRHWVNMQSAIEDLARDINTLHNCLVKLEQEMEETKKKTT